MINSKIQTIRSHFRKTDQIIYKTMKDVDFDEWVKPDRPKDGLSYFRHLSREIIGQQLSGKAANAIIERFKKLFENGEVDPHQLLTTSDQRLRDAGMSWAKASYVKNIAQAYLDDSVKFDKFDQLPDEEIIHELTTIKGVGPWTAEMFLIFTLHRPDVFSFGDLGLKKGFAKLYGIENPTKVQIEEVIVKWKPYTSYGSITLWHSLDNR